MVEFVSYTGKYPSLCFGVLTLKINNEIYNFGMEENNYKCFWSSGGDVGYDEDYIDSFVNKNKWKINVELLPEQLRKYYEEIEEVFNCNVPFGCCGGCL